jgi:hypothetical protein
LGYFLLKAAGDKIVAVPFIDVKGFTSVSGVMYSSFCKNQHNKVPNRKKNHTERKSNLFFDLRIAFEPLISLSSTNPAIC